MKQWYLFDEKSAPDHQRLAYKGWAKVTGVDLSKPFLFVSNFNKELFYLKVEPSRSGGELLLDKICFKLVKKEKVDLNDFL